MFVLRIELLVLMFFAMSLGFSRAEQNVCLICDPGGTQRYLSCISNFTLRSSIFPNQQENEMESIMRLLYDVIENLRKNHGKNTSLMMQAMQAAIVSALTELINDEDDGPVRKVKLDTLSEAFSVCLPPTPGKIDTKFASELQGMFGAFSSGGSPGKTESYSPILPRVPDSIQFPADSNTVSKIESNARFQGPSNNFQAPTPFVPPPFSRTLRSSPMSNNVLPSSGGIPQLQNKLKIPPSLQGANFNFPVSSQMKQNNFFSPPSQPQFANNVFEKKSSPAQISISEPLKFAPSSFISKQGQSPIVQQTNNQFPASPPQIKSDVQTYVSPNSNDVIQLPHANSGYGETFNTNKASNLPILPPNDPGSTFSNNLPVQTFGLPSKPQIPQNNGQFRIQQWNQPFFQKMNPLPSITAAPIPGAVPGSQIQPTVSSNSGIVPPFLPVNKDSSPSQQYPIVSGSRTWTPDNSANSLQNNFPMGQMASQNLQKQNVPPALEEREKLYPPNPNFQQGPLLPFPNNPLGGVASFISKSPIIPPSTQTFISPDNMKPIITNVNKNNQDIAPKDEFRTKVAPTPEVKIQNMSPLNQQFGNFPKKYENSVLPQVPKPTNFVSEPIIPKNIPEYKQSNANNQVNLQLEKPYQEAKNNLNVDKSLLEMKETDFASTLNLLLVNSEPFNTLFTSAEEENTVSEYSFTIAKYSLNNYGEAISFPAAKAVEKESSKVTKGSKISEIADVFVKHITTALLHNQLISNDPQSQAKTCADKIITMCRVLIGSGTSETVNDTKSQPLEINSEILKKQGPQNVNTKFSSISTIIPESSEIPDAHLTDENVKIFAQKIYQTLINSPITNAILTENASDKQVGLYSKAVEFALRNYGEDVALKANEYMNQAVLKLDGKINPEKYATEITFAITKSLLQPFKISVSDPASQAFFIASDIIAAIMKFYPSNERNSAESLPSKPVVKNSEINIDGKKSSSVMLYDNPISKVGVINIPQQTKMNLSSPNIQQQRYNPNPNLITPLVTSSLDYKKATREFSHQFYLRLVGSPDFNYVYYYYPNSSSPALISESAKYTLSDCDNQTSSKAAISILTSLKDLPLKSTLSDYANAVSVGVTDYAIECGLIILSNPILEADRIAFKYIDGIKFLLKNNQYSEIKQDPNLNQDSINTNSPVSQDNEIGIHPGVVTLAQNIFSSLMESKDFRQLYNNDNTNEIFVNILVHVVLQTLKFYGDNIAVDSVENIESHLKTIPMQSSTNIYANAVTKIVVSSLYKHNAIDLKNPMAQGKDIGSKLLNNLMQSVPNPYSNQGSGNFRLTNSKNNANMILFSKPKPNDVENSHNDAVINNIQTEGFKTKLDTVLENIISLRSMQQSNVNINAEILSKFIAYNMIKPEFRIIITNILDLLVVSTNLMLSLS